MEETQNAGGDPCSEKTEHAVNDELSNQDKTETVEGDLSEELDLGDIRAKWFRQDFIQSEQSGALSGPGGGGLDVQGN